MQGNQTYAHSSRWIWIASLWLAFGLVGATQTVFVMRSEGMHHAWGTLFFTSVLSWVPWALATPLVMRLGRRFPPVEPGSILMWVTHLLACAAIGLTFSAWSSALDFFLNPYANPTRSHTFARLWLNTFSNGILSFLLLYAVILVVNYVLESRARLAHQQTETARLNEQLSKAQLDALRRQIEPHFLFNTLNSVTGLVREGRNESAVSMIAELSDFMRRVLSDSTRQEVPLGEEMEFAQRYLEIQKARFAERLQLSVDVPSELLLAQVPALILQPIVENAVKHGIAKRAQGGKIHIAAFRSEGALTLSVYNDGPGLPANWQTAPSGIGISNMRTRLRSLYGDACALQLENDASGGELSDGTGGVKVSVSVPFKE